MVSKNYPMPRVSKTKVYMTKKEYIEAYCDGCMNHSNCAYRNRGMQCHLVDNIDDIWDTCETDMIEKAYKWVLKHLPISDLKNGQYICFSKEQHDMFAQGLKEALEKQTQK